MYIRRRACKKAQSFVECPDSQAGSSSPAVLLKTDDDWGSETRPSVISVPSNAQSSTSSQPRLGRGEAQPTAGGSRYHPAKRGTTTSSAPPGPNTLRALDACLALSLRRSAVKLRMMSLGPWRGIPRKDVARTHAQHGARALRQMSTMRPCQSVAPRVLGRYCMGSICLSDK